MRAIIKLVLFGSLCCVTFILLITRFILPNPYQRRWRALILKNASLIGLAILGIRLTVKGKFPQAPFLMVTNHLSYVDMFILASQSGCIFVAKEETASWPLIGPFVKSLGTIFINRTRARDTLRVGQIIDNEIKAGEGIVIFPEATSSPGSEILPFKAALLDIAAHNGYPVWAGSFFYKTPQGTVPAHLSVSWWGDMTFWPHWMTFLALPSLEAQLIIAPEPQKAQEARQLALLLENKVKEIFQPTFRGEMHGSSRVC